MALFAAPAGAAPTCAEGPQIVGNEYVGTPCDDTIRMPRSVTVAHGEGGNDTIYGQRGNDRIFGDAGNDRLYGGIGDDQLKGGDGDDLLSGGFGADSVLDGEAGDDFVRGDATIDNIQNTGGGTDTLSYATGVTPGFFDRAGFPDFSVYENFPQSREGRGVYLDLGPAQGDNGRAPEGGGFDEEIAGAAFDVVIGTPFDDYLVGTTAAETFYGGGGADVILGGGGGDQIYGGAEGDYCDETEATTDECEFEADDKKVGHRDSGSASAGEMAPQANGPPAFYLAGSETADAMSASYSPELERVSFNLTGGTGFDLAATEEGGCTLASATEASCPALEAPDSIVVAGLGGGDSLDATGFPPTTSVVLLGGDAGDDLVGGETEDALVDGAGNDTVEAAGGDDALPNNSGGDDLDAGPGEDLFVSDAVCDGDSLDGGPGRDNANWANFAFAVSIDMGAERAGLVSSDGEPDCEGGPLTVLRRLEDIEGTSAGDVMIGDSGPNQLLGRSGPDRYYAGGGNDSILANSGVPPTDDPDPTIDCGPDWDTAQIDHPENGPDAAPIDCESIYERDPNSFRPPDTPPDPDPPPSGAASPPIPTTVIVEPPRIKDRTPPRTGIAHRPRRRVFTARRVRRVVFAFRSNERPVRFRCKLDRDRFRPCGSRRAYRLRPGRHALRVFAIDRAGNRDRSPAVFRFAVRRVSVHWIRSHRRRGPTR